MSRYLDLLKLPNARALLITSFPARIAYGMLALAAFFKVERETGSVAAAGLAIGAFSLSQSLTAGIRGSVIDRYGQKWPLRILTPSYCAMVLYFNTLTERNSLLIFALVMGLTSPPINLSVRPLWKIAVKPEQLRTAYALDTSVMNIATVFGPVIATTISLSKYPDLALNSVGILILIGGLSLSFTKIARNSIPEPREIGGIPLWKNKGMQLLMVEGIFIGFGWGAFDVGVPAFATLEKIPGWTGPILGAMGVAAVIGGLYAEPGFSDVDVNDLSKELEISTKVLRGVLGSLVKKGIVSVDENGGGYDIIYMRESYWYLVNEEWAAEARVGC